MNESLVLTDYSHETCLPCELNEVVTHIRRKNITADRDEKVGLKKDIHAIPLNRGYLLHTKDLVLVANSIQPLLQIDGTHTIDEISSTQEMKSNLQQLHYYDLLSFGSNRGHIKTVDILEKYKETSRSNSKQCPNLSLLEQKYKGNDFVTFPLMPTTVELDITNDCNFRCIHCSRDAKPRKKDYAGDELSTKELMDVIDECAKIGVPELIMMGGEPLYHSDFFKLVQHSKEKGIRDVRTSTNAWNINEGTAKELSKYFNNIQISVHGASSSTHDSIVNKKGAFDQAKQATELLKKYNLKVQVSFTVMRENVDDISKMPYLVKEWGGDYLRFIRLNKQGRGALLKGWNDEEVEQIGKEIKRIYDNLPSGLELEAGGFPPLHPIRNDATFYGCSAGKTLLSITSNGKAKVCGALDDYVGDIREKSILDIWHSPGLIQMRKQSNCDCNYRPICYGLCMVPP
jgi:radical SAM protein with 4Fe4S-binding SPASM domain